MPTNTSPVVAISAGTIILVVLGSIYTFGALTPYIASYLHYHNDPASNTALSVLFTAALVCTNMGQIASSALSKKFSNRILCLASVTLISGAVFAVSFLQNFIGYIFFYGLIYGFSIGIGYVPPMKNAYLHLPHRKGLVAGICMSGFGLGSVLFNQIIVLAVNPNNIPIDHDTKLFPQQVADNLPFALRILSLSFFIPGALASLLIKEPKTRDTLFSETMLSQDQNQRSEIMPDEKKAQEKAATTLYCEKKAYFLTIQLACMIPFGVFLASSYKDFAFQMNSDFQDKDHLITILGSIGIFCNGIFRSMWGYLFDRFSYRSLTNIINIVLLICCGTLIFAVKWYFSYLLLVLLVYMSYGGMYALMPTQSVRLLGEKQGTQIYWAVFGGFSFAAVLQFILRYFLLNQFGNQGYTYCIIIFGILSVCGLVLNQVVKYQTKV